MSYCVKDFPYDIMNDFKQRGLFQELIDGQGVHGKLTIF